MFFIKRILTFFTAVVSLIAGVFGGTGDCLDQKSDSFRVTTYVNSEHIYSPEAFCSEDFDIITDVIIFGAATFDSEGNVHTDKERLERTLIPLRKIIADRDVAVTVNLLGPWGHTDSDVWEDQMDAMGEEHKKAFTSGVLEDNIIALLDEYDFDGVHFDYEYPISLKHWFYYNNFLVSLDKKLGDYTLGVAGNEWNLKFSTKALKAIDTLELMMYDMYDSEGKHATYETVAELIKKVELSGVPLEKVNLGIPFYARPTDGTAYWYGYNGCYDGIDENGRYRDESIGKDFWFNTPDVVEKKTQLAIKEGYGGVMIWHYSCDLPSTHEDSLLGAIGRAVDVNY